MFSFFGGIPEYLVVDNLKSGVLKAHRYDPDLNPTYCDYATHMGFVVFPARTKTPRDKPAVEGAIGVIQRQFYAQMRNHIFYSIQQMNEKLRIYLDQLNHALMKDYALTRAEQFQIELPQLKPIPTEAFEIVEYRNAKVHPDCHVQVDRCFYSVPYSFIGQNVRIQLKLNLVEIYSQDHQSIALHARAQGVGVFSMHDSHYPQQKVVAARFDVVALKKEAQRIGAETLAVADELLSGHSPLRYLRRVQGIVRLAKALPGEAIEYGCKQARLFGRLRLRYITDCATQFHRNGARPLLVKIAPQRQLSELFLHEKD